MLAMLSGGRVVQAVIVEVDRQVAISPIGEYRSQYSPWVMHESGWGSHVMFYCRNTNENGKMADRVWRAENWKDGVKGDWGGEMIVIDGTLGELDDLSCSPGVVIGTDSKWHMYYVTAERNKSCDLYLYHAVASSPGVNWEKKGAIRIEGINWPVTNCGMETPSPFLVDGKIRIYVPYQTGKLLVADSSDGHIFGNTKIIDLPDKTSGIGRVMLKNNLMYYVYGKNINNNPYEPTNQIWITGSRNGGLSFVASKKLFEVSGLAWSPQLLWNENGVEKVYYAEVDNLPRTAERWFGDNTSIGVRSFEGIESMFVEGDFDEDGEVGMLDFGEWKKRYLATPPTMTLVEFGVWKRGYLK